VELEYIRAVSPRLLRKSPCSYDVPGFFEPANLHQYQQIYIQQPRQISKIYNMLEFGTTRSMSSDGLPGLPTSGVVEAMDSGSQIGTRHMSRVPHPGPGESIRPASRQYRGFDLHCSWSSSDSESDSGSTTSKGYAPISSGSDVGHDRTEEIGNLPSWSRSTCGMDLHGPFTSYFDSTSESEQELDGPARKFGPNNRGYYYSDENASCSIAFWSPCESSFHGSRPSESQSSDADSEDLGSVSSLLDATWIQGAECNSPDSLTGFEYSDSPEMSGVAIPVTFPSPCWHQQVNIGLGIGLFAFENYDTLPLATSEKSRAKKKIFPSRIPIPVSRIPKPKALVTSEKSLTKPKVFISRIPVLASRIATPPRKQQPPVVTSRKLSARLEKPLARSSEKTSKSKPRWRV
jgi:hypothetical protein